MVSVGFYPLVALAAAHLGTEPIGVDSAALASEVIAIGEVKTVREVGTDAVVELDGGHAEVCGDSPNALSSSAIAVRFTGGHTHVRAGERRLFLLRSQPTAAPSATPPFVPAMEPPIIAPEADTAWLAYLRAVCAMRGKRGVIDSVAHAGKLAEAAASGVPGLARFAAQRLLSFDWRRDAQLVRYATVVASSTRVPPDARATYADRLSAHLSADALADIASSAPETLVRLAFFLAAGPAAEPSARARATLRTAVGGSDPVATAAARSLALRWDGFGRARLEEAQSSPRGDMKAWSADGLQALRVRNRVYSGVGLTTAVSVAVAWLLWLRQKRG